MHLGTCCSSWPLVIFHLIFLTTLFHTTQAIPQPGVLDNILDDVAGPLLNPLHTVIKSVLNGDGLVQGVLGALGGALGQEATYDYIVVGGGTAGNAIGYRLAEAGHSVAIIEAGIFYEIAKPVLGTTPAGDIIGIGSSMLDLIPTVDWALQTEPQTGANGRRLHYAQGKCLGGSSALNFMIYHRGSEGAYQKWADEVGDQSYTLANLTRYFKKSATLTPPNTQVRRANASTEYDASAFHPEGGGGPVYVGYTNWVSVWATWLEKGLLAAGMKRTTGFSSGKLLGYHYTQTTVRASDQTRSTSAQYIYQANRTESVSGRLKIYTQTKAHKILLDASTKRATGVQVNSLGIGYKIHARKEVILSAGAFHSPQLLMLSGIGPRETLQKHGIEMISDLPGVGQNMWDHIMFGPAYEVKFDTLDRVLHDPVVLADALQQYVLSRQGPLSSNVVEFVGWEKLPQKYRDTWTPATRQAMDTYFTDDWPEVEHISGNGYIGNFAFPALQQPLDGNQYATNLGALVAPLSRGNVTISSSSPTVAPLINPNWLTHPADQEVAVSWWRRMREIWHSDALREILVHPQQEYWPGLDVATDAEILHVIRDSLMPVWHAAGTCKMGRSDDPSAVIDNEARVFGVEGLRVVDASSFPLLPPGHPQSTIYALAEKIADIMIKSAS